MKTYLLLFCCLCSVGLAHAQNQASDFTGNKSDQARNPRNDLMNFVPNEVLVKFKDAVPMAVGARLKAAGISSIDKVLAAHGITSLEKLFPAEQKPLKVRMMKSPQGKDMKIPALDKIYRVSVPIATTNSTVPTNIFQLIEELKALPEVDYAEPNYIYSIDNTQPVGPILTAEDVSKMQTPKQKSTNDLVIPNDPLYGQQWYIPAVKADSVWQQTTGDTTQVIAILDTGVDWNHPDLKNKIWTNPNPATSWNMDGIMDDIRGWDFINNDNNPMDDNSHGTHVAGIAAAETNNGIGIAGVCPKAKIMPIKVFQSSGRGDAATITKGIIYASTHGATVINMSFGSYARSLTMEDALANAYATTILVAAAGNDGLFIGPLPPFFLASYPAALSFVLGVQVPYTSFSNYDQDGSVFSDYPDLLNYEMKAPGTNILSTIPNGNYRVYQGTSMAAPIVSGAVCLYKNRHPNDSQELMWGNLINTTSTFLDIDSAIKITPKPKLMFVTKLITDTIVGDDKDGIVDAGETIELTYTIRNTWGQCDSVMLGLNFGEFEDKTTAQIITPTAFIGSVSSYATKSNKYNPLKILINKNVANNRDIQFLASLWYPNSTDTIKQKLILNVTNGEELSGVMDTTLILTSDKLWIVNKSFRITGHLIIEPGTKLIINNTIDNRGIITAIGKTDSIIDISGPKSIQGGSNGEFKYTRFHDINESLGSSYTGAGSMNFENCIFEGMNSLNAPINVGYGLFTSYNLKMTDCLIRNSFVNTVFAYAHQPLDFKRNTVDNILSRGGSNTQSMYNSPIRYNNFLRFKDYEYVTFGLEKYSKFLMCKDNNENGGISLLQNNILASTFEHIYFYKADGNSNIYNIPQQYWGTTDPLKIDPVVYDFNDNSGLPEIRFKPMMVAPSDSAHAIVWKVLVNGKDAQDEFVEPVGVGKQRFDVYFNRAMDNTVIPKVSFGVRYPYSQQSVNEEGTWSEDTKIYTVYKTIKLTTGDGINIVRVAGAKEINGWEHEIPIEDSRFSFIISAANAASTEFMATQGLGKVKLEWNNSDLEDGLGYNMYRMEHINDSTLTEAVMINPTLI
ncbi:MAG: S8 family serine peptidase, partial [Bacteroidales bacterium]